MTSRWVTGEVGDGRHSFRPGLEMLSVVKEYLTTEISFSRNAPAGFGNVVNPAGAFWLVGHGRSWKNNFQN